MCLFFLLLLQTFTHMLYPNINRAFFSFFSSGRNINIESHLNDSAPFILTDLLPVDHRNANPLIPLVRKPNASHHTDPSRPTPSPI